MRHNSIILGAASLGVAAAVASLDEGDQSPPENAPVPQTDHLADLEAAGLPLSLSSDRNSAFYDPRCLRVGVRIDGKERTDITEYHVRLGEYRVQGMNRSMPPLLAGNIEPYWRYEESRQQRRARERWEAKHGR